MDEDHVSGKMLRKIQEMEQGYEEMKLEMSALVVGSRASQRPQPRGLLLSEYEKASSRAARAMDKRYMNIVQSMGQSVHMLDCNYRVIYWGVNSVKLFGYTTREALGESIIDLAIGVEDRAAARTIISKFWRQVVLPSVNEQPAKESRLSKFKNKTASKLGIDPQQPLQAAITSRISNLASRISSKVGNKIRSIGTREKNQEQSLDNDINQSGHYLSSTTLPADDTRLGRLRISDTSSSSYGVFSELQPDRKPHGNSFSDFDDATEVTSGSQNRVYSETEMVFGHGGLQGLYRSEGGERQAAAIYNDTSGSCSSLYSVNSINKIHSPGSTSSSSNCGNISSNYIPGTDVDPDFADYEILWEHLTVGTQVGQGSCGTVYHAQWYGSDVAVKVFSNQEYSDDMISSFRKELSLMKRLRHPNILLFMGAVTVGGHLCIITEYLPRGSLFQLLRKKSMKLDWRRRIHMAMDIAQGMNYLHRSNPPVVHRDLKSSNLLVDKNWNVKVGDFGLSRVKLETYLMTKTGKGTPQWMAPESLRHEPSDEKSDIYSYGVVLWELATGKIPWGDLNPMQVIGVVGFKNQRLEIPYDVDPQWASIIESCWRSDPRSRPTFLELLQRLRDLQTQFGSQRQLSAAESAAED